MKKNTSGWHTSRVDLHKYFNIDRLAADKRGMKESDFASGIFRIKKIYQTKKGFSAEIEWLAETQKECNESMMDYRKSKGE